MCPNEAIEQLLLEVITSRTIDYGLVDLIDKLRNAQLQNDDIFLTRFRIIDTFHSGCGRLWVEAW